MASSYLPTYGYYVSPPLPDSPPPTSQSNGGYEPPLPSKSSSPPPSSSHPPPTPSISPPPPLPSSPPPPARAPPLMSSPPPSALSPSSPIVSSPPPSNHSSPTNSSSPPLPVTSPPPSLAPPPTPALPPPPPDNVPPPKSPRPPSLPSSLPPTSPISAPPPTTVPPPLPSYQLPSPPLAKPPTASPPPPPLVEPPISSSPPPSLAVPPPTISPPPPLAKPPMRSPPPPVLRRPPPPPLDPQTPASSPLTPPPEVQPLPPPPATPTVHSPPTPEAPLPLPKPRSPSDGGSKSSSSASNITTGIKSNNTSSLTTATMAVVAGLVVLSLLGAVVWLVRKRRRPIDTYNTGFVMPSPAGSPQMSAPGSNYARSPSSPLVRTGSRSYGVMYSPSDRSLGSSKAWFMYEELSSITNGFAAQNLLGQGGFGSVYKGCLQDGRQVAVKQLKVGGAQGEREFRAEVEIISRVHHRHLVSLVGYCISENQRLLVYDYVPNNTLDYHLHGKGRPVMDWATRVKVAAGAARGIAYLHEDCHPRIIHRDIKSSNILLDNNYEAQVSDFGLARLTMDACTHVTTRVMGTFGYLAPEYASTGKLTAKSDVYSFGVVLLELVTGRKPVDTSQPLGDESLVEWARPLLIHALESREFAALSDPKLENNFNEREMFCMIEAAATCVRHSAAMRPRMAQVLRALDSLSESDLNHGVQPGQSVLFNSAQHSAEIRRFHRMAYSSQDYGSDLSRSSWRSRTDL